MNHSGKVFVHTPPVRTRNMGDPIPKREQALATGVEGYPLPHSLGVPKRVKPQRERTMGYGRLRCRQGLANDGGGRSLTLQSVQTGRGEAVERLMAAE